MIKLPGEFLSIMQAELGVDYDAFLQSYDMPAKGEHAQSQYRRSKKAMSG